ncbi:MAG: 4Fe-4S binding protein [Candidatus Aminicenantes bacterium]|nr:4Fe-4S binding protein [Candidatus Aminicenantes bacterium]
MIRQKGKKIQRIRIFTQVLFLVLFFWLLIGAGATATETFTCTDYFFYFDPLLLILNFIATHTISALFLLSLIPVALTLVFGRFFCGWVCPFGAINQFFSWIFRKSRKKKEPVDKRFLKVKYVILLLVLAAALMGTHIGGWFDPFSLLTRSSTVVVSPAVNYMMENSLKEGAGDTGILAKGLKPAYDFARKNILTNKQRGYVQSVFIGAIFFFLLFMNLYKRRFFCNYLCPLGALYGLIAKFSFFNFKVNDKCTSCKACAKNCTYNGSPFEDYTKAECLTCFNCLDDCKFDAIDVVMAPPKKENRPVIDLGRRKVAGSIVSGLVLAALPRVSAGVRSRIHRFVRPPGSVKEKEFLEKCIRCGECMQVCPTNFIQPALFESGVDGMWTPITNPQTGYCEYECFKCTEVCPTEAIERLTLEQKKEFKMGIAVVDRNRCYTYADGYNCAVCEEHCPVPDKAIRFREVSTWNFEGKLVNVKQIYVVPDLCIGCGICENVCPRLDAPGILNTAEEEQREAEY